MKLQTVLTAKSHHKYNLWELREHRFVITFAGLMIHDWHNQLSCILAWIDQNNKRITCKQQNHPGSRQPYSKCLCIYQHHFHIHRLLEDLHHSPHIQVSNEPETIFVTVKSFKIHQVFRMKYTNLFSHRQWPTENHASCEAQQDHRWEQNLHPY